MRVCGPQVLLDDVQHRDLCVGCGGCVDLCPYFKTDKGKTAMVFPCESDAGRCHAHCPWSDPISGK